MPNFDRYIGIDYSGAGTAESTLKGLRVYEGSREEVPREVMPSTDSRKKLWSRRGVAEWLEIELRQSPPVIVGIDHGFSFPLQYFEAHRIPADWIAFLQDFQLHWPTDRENTSVDFVRNAICGNGAARSGNSRWRRLTEIPCRAKSVFHFDVPGSVAKSTHAGLPWLLRIRRELGNQVHFWPFDGWMPPVGCSVVAEVYPALCSKSFPQEGRTGDQHDAFSVAQWLRLTDSNEGLQTLFTPPIPPGNFLQAQCEGWILGIT